jgi:type I restriction-modification system DNA methylase subunit
MRRISLLERGHQYSAVMSSLRDKIIRVTDLIQCEFTDCHFWVQHFEKGKRQNRLRDEDIEKILETYQFRKEEERYSKRIPMERIKEEGYNLNISRYISTAIAESEIDLAATHAALEAIENTIQEATIKHNKFLEELGLPPLPSSHSSLD